ncbi:MAG: beta-1,6-N-acetylglucosaminyltransferase [Alphaproteobacteria bacterium]|nr:beta-1,6-N-acetylglucosaminyltransferase [Alphaproteobacteria bacterium]
MAQIAFILLCHKDPAAIIQQARRLTRAGDRMAIHFDASAARGDYERITSALCDNPRVTFARQRVRCGWGEWSLVQATLNAVRAAVDAFPEATHFYMLSGDCMAIKPAEYVHDYLDREDSDFIESFDFFKSDWIKTGIKEERLIYRHLFNERNQKRLFYASMRLQQRLGLAREVPSDIQMMIGSQWWCLRRRTIEWLLDFIDKRRDVLRFFRTTWIPDETFFQTLVRHLVPAEQIRSRTLTFLLFSDYGIPVQFYNDHYDMLVGQDFLFARKISPQADALKKRLGELYVSTGTEIPISGEGAKLYTFVTERGRIGQRFAPRFWEKEASLGRARELMIVACKKWHVAKRLLDQLSFHSNVPTAEYLFDEESTVLPDLGGIEATLEKRTRHRRALTRMLFDYYESDRLVICMDPANIDLLRDFYADRSQTRLLEIECDFTDQYLVGHARRVGLAGERTSQDTIERLLPTIRNDVIFESDRLRDEQFPNHFRMRQAAPPEENAPALAEFFTLPEDRALEIARTDLLFKD